jgi:hypothetical protein
MLVKGVLSSWLTVGNRLVKSVWQVLTAALQNVYERLAQRFRGLPDERRPVFRFQRCHSKNALRHGVGKFHVLLRIDDQHGIGKGINRGLARLQRARQLRFVGLAVVSKLTGHGVESTRQLSQFIVGCDGDELIEVSCANRRDRFRHGPYRLLNRAHRGRDKKHGQRNADR